MIVVNLFGAPGAGKSTGAAHIFSKLKMRGINAELVTEYAKDKTWEKNEKALQNQLYVCGKQFFRMTRCQDEVDVIITDSPLLLNILYNQHPLLGEDFNHMVYHVFNGYNNLNFFINRVKPYNPKGRNQTEKQSDALVGPLKTLLREWDIEYTDYNGTEEDYDKIVEDIIKRLTNEI